MSIVKDFHEKTIFFKTYSKSKLFFYNKFYFLFYFIEYFEL